MLYKLDNLNKLNLWLLQMERGQVQEIKKIDMQGPHQAENSWINKIFVYKSNIIL